ncbi:B-block binding subunit of tfiiic, partial [Globisporangium splendens]
MAFPPHHQQQAVPMPTFIARCLEEIGLEGRCGIPIKDMFALVDPANDVVYRKYAWHVLRTMTSHVQFCRMMRIADSDSVRAAGAASLDETAAAVSTGHQHNEKRHSMDDVSSPMSSPPRQKRKWSTTLMASPESEHSEDTPQKRAAEANTKKKYKQKLEPVVPSARRNASKKQRKLLSSRSSVGESINKRVAGSSKKEEQATSSGSRSRQAPIKKERRRRSVDAKSGDASDIDNEEEQGKDKQSAPDYSADSEKKPASSQPDFRSRDDAQDPEGMGWIYRSPRGFVLGEQADVSNKSYEDAIMDSPESVLGVVACEELRLKYLGVVDPALMDTISPQFDLLEMIGRSRERGENAAALTNSNVFGDSRKLHYLLDVLIASNYVEKNMVTADQRRFNILHLARFADKFHPSMVSPTATMECEAFPKQFVPQVIAEMLIARGERTCVFADIGRELGYDKRQQEKLRKYFFHQMQAHRNFPLELFMARCNTGAEYKGRKLWCIRLRHAPNSRARGHSTDNFEPVDPLPTPTMGPVIERGIMEQMFTSIQNRKQAGATIPEIRDLLGVPTFKLPYKLAQGLISKYKVSVEQVVVGKSTMYRMYVPGDDLPHLIEAPSDQNEQQQLETKKHEHDKPSTMIGAARGVLIASTVERRKEFMMDRIRQDKIMSVHQLRTNLIAAERESGNEFGVIDIRSIRRILEELEAAKLIVTLDITLPPKRVLQKNDRVVKCVALPGYHCDRTAIIAFVDAYVEQQQKKYVNSLGDGQHDNEDVVVVSNRNRGRKAKIQDETKEVVKYTATSYKIARVNLVKLFKQNRKLGMFIGTLYRCRALHILLWEKVDYLRQKAKAMESVDKNGRLLDADAQKQQADQSEAGVGDVTFALKEVLKLLSIKEYIQLAGVNELLTDSEENKVRMAITRGDSWDILSEPIRQKVRGCEADRFSRILRVLIELGLIQGVSGSSRGLLNVFRSSDDLELMVSNVAFATLSGGLFKLKERVRIAVKRGEKVLKQLPTKQSYVYAASFSGKGRSDHFTGRVPLDFQLKGGGNAKEYWKSLRFLSLEGARMGSGAKNADSVSVNLDSELIRAAPLRDNNIYTLRVWVPHGLANLGRTSAKAKAADAVAEPMQFLKRKRFQNNPTVLTGDLKKRKTESGSRVVDLRRVSHTDDTEAAVSRFRRLVADKQSLRASKWTLEEDMKLMDSYVHEMSCQWFIEIPLALQKDDERLAFRNTSLERTRISWKGLAKALSKNSKDCYLRVRELMTVPAVRARVESTKASITHMKNPGGKFYEELEVAKQPRLAALLNRALQILFHERASYYPLLADMLISQWNEGEVKLVWRYLWLAGLITRTRKPVSGDQKERGFCIHSRVHEMKSLHIAHYSMEVFCEAAEYASFVQENVKECVMLEGEEACEENEGFFEHDLEPNAGAGQAAVELSSMVLSISEMVPEYVEPDPDRHNADSEETKKAMAVKGLAGHLANRCGGAVPDDFLKDYWTVKSRAHVALLNEVNHEMILDRAKTMEAFSTSPALKDEYASGAVNGKAAARKRSDTDWSALVIVALDKAGSNGLSFAELMRAIQVDSCMEASKQGIVTKPARCASTSLEKEPLVMREVDSLVRQSRVIEVNGYAHVRFVLKEHGDIWTLNPYRVSNKSTDEKTHFVFDKTQAIVARPWYLLDGSANTKVELVLKRKVVNIIMCSPGIQDHVLHRKTHKLLSIQSLRSLVDELIQDEVVYARLSRGAALKPTSIFKSSSSSRPSTDERAMAAIAPGDLRFVDTTKDAVHYFPSINCVELLGAAACDADLRRNC